MVRLDDIIQKPNGRRNDLRESDHVEFETGRGLLHKLAQTYAPEITAFERKQRLLAARIGCFDKPQFRCWICFIDMVNKNDPRLPAFPGFPYNEVKNLSDTPCPIVSFF